MEILLYDRSQLFLSRSGLGIIIMYASGLRFCGRIRGSTLSQQLRMLSQIGDVLLACIVAYISSNG